MKGDMEVEVLTEPSDLEHAAKRAKRIFMDADEMKLYCEAPNAARGNKHPGYSTDEDY